MKKSIAFLLLVALLTGCDGDGGSQHTQTSQSDALSAEATTAVSVPSSVTTTVATTATAVTACSEAQTEAAFPEEHIPVPSDGRLVNDDGTLTEAFLHNLDELRLACTPSAYGMGIYPALYDFNEDRVPEIIVIMSNGGQGEMPCKVYDPYTLEIIGEFQGYCRDGYTRFSQMNGKTVIHDYWEHSNWQRSESFDIAEITENVFEITEHYYSYGQLNVGEVQPTMSVGYTEEYLSLINSGFSFEIMDDTVSRFAQEYDISTYRYWGTDYDDRFRLLYDLYNDYIRIRNIAAIDEPEILSVADYDGDGRHEAFYIDTDNGAYFVNSDGEKTLLWEKQGITTAYRLWDNIMVLQPYGNSSCCRVYAVSYGGIPTLVEAVSDKGMYFDYSNLYNGDFQLTDSKNELTHTFKTYQFYTEYTTGELIEYGSIRITEDEFISVYGDSAERYIDIIQSEHGTVTDILYRMDHVVIINYTVSDDEGTTKTRYILLKPRFYESESLTEISSGSGRYDTAISPEIANYPHEMYIPEWTDEISAEAAVASDMTFIDDAEYYNTYDASKFALSSDEAMSDIIDILISSEKWKNGFKLICTGTAALNMDMFYQITLSDENDFTCPRIAVFWVDTQSGEVYLKFDPTLDSTGLFSEFSSNISESDLRTRLISFYS